MLNNRISVKHSKMIVCHKQLKICLWFQELFVVFGFIYYLFIHGLCLGNCCKHIAYFWKYQLTETDIDASYVLKIIRHVKSIMYF